LEPDGEKLMNALIDRRMMSRLNLEGAFDFGKMLRQQIDGKRDSWGVRWVASAVLAGKLSLFPAKSLVKNTGYDGDGSHCGYINCYDTDISNDPVNIASIPIEEDKQAVAAIRDFQRTRKFRFLMRMLLGCLKKNRRIPGR
jgi:hypothetical protein